MDPLVVIIPVKSAGKKSRLSDLLSSTQRGQFSKLMLRNVLRALSQAGLGRIHVVSSDVEILEFAQGHGAKPVPEASDSGVNEAVRTGIRATHAKEYLILPSDLPFLGPSDLLSMLKLWAGGLDLVVSPSCAFDGTNALLFAPGTNFPLSYDRDSFWNHLYSAAKLELSVGVCSRIGVMFDIDTPEDFRSLATSPGRSPPVEFSRAALK